MERRPSFAKLKPAARSFTGRYQTHMVLLKENSREGKEPRVVLRPSPTEARPRVLPAAKPRLLTKSYAALDVRPRVLPAGDGPRARPAPAPPPGKPRHGTPIRQAAAAYRKPHDLSSRAVDHADAEPHDSSPPRQLNRGGGWAGGRRLVFDRREALSPPVVAKAKSAVAVGEPPDRILPLAAAKPFVVLSYCKETDGGRGEKRMWQIANFLLRHGIHSFNRLQGSARPSAPGSDRSREWRSKLQAAGVCIALVGPKYFASSSCNAELQEAIKKGVPILPICFDTQRVQEQSRFEAERLPTLRRTIKTPLEAARTVPLSFVSHAEWRARRENGVFGTEDGQRALGTWLPEHGRFQDDWEAHLKTLLAMVTGHLRRAREKAEEALHIAATGMTEEEKAAAERAPALQDGPRAAAERRRRHPAVAAAERAAAAKAAAEEAAAAARAEREAAAAAAAAAAGGQQRRRRHGGPQRRRRPQRTRRRDRRRRPRWRRRRRPPSRRRPPRRRWWRRRSARGRWCPRSLRRTTRTSRRSTWPQARPGRPDPRARGSGRARRRARRGLARHAIDDRCTAQPDGCGRGAVGAQGRRDAEGGRREHGGELREGRDPAAPRRGA